MFTFSGLVYPGNSHRAEEIAMLMNNIQQGDWFDLVFQPGISQVFHSNPLVSEWLVDKMKWNKTSKSQIPR